MYNGWDVSDLVYYKFSSARKWVKLKVGLSPSKKICRVYLNESPLKMMKITFYFIFEALFMVKIKLNFKIYDVTTWLTNNGNTNISQYLTR